MLQVFSMPCGFLELDSTLFFPDQETGSPLVVPVWKEIPHAPEPLAWRASRCG